MRTECCGAVDHWLNLTARATRPEHAIRQALSSAGKSHCAMFCPACMLLPPLMDPLRMDQGESAEPAHLAEARSPGPGHSQAVAWLAAEVAPGLRHGDPLAGGLPLASLGGALQGVGGASLPGGGRQVGEAGRPNLRACARGGGAVGLGEVRPGGVCAQGKQQQLYGPEAQGTAHDGNALGCSEVCLCRSASGLR